MGSEYTFIIIATHEQGRNEGRQGGTILQAPKSPSNVTSTFFNTVHLLPKDLGFEHGGAKVASCYGPHLNSLRPCPRNVNKQPLKFRYRTNLMN